MRNEKTNILLKDKLTDLDKDRLEFLNKKLNISPVFTSKESINAEELIKKALLYKRIIDWSKDKVTL